MLLPQSEVKRQAHRHRKAYSKLSIEHHFGRELLGHLVKDSLKVGASEDYSERRTSHEEC